MASNPVRHRLCESQMAALGAISTQEDIPNQVFETVPAAKYFEPGRFELEKAAIFNREPILVGTTAYIPKPNMYFQTEVLGVLILVTRDKNGEVRAFLNVCRHRGTMLCPNAEPAKGSRISCPYHAWTYTLDGRLTGVPREDAFPGLDKNKYGLVQLPCAEAGGLIYVGLQPGSKVDFSDVTGALARDLDGMGMGDMHVYKKTTYKLQANWKFIMDTMLDKYHVLRLHQNTLAKFFDDSPEVSDMVGPHVRSASSTAKFNPEDISEDFEVIRWKAVFGYILYPLGAIVVSPRYVSLCVPRPVSVDRTDVDYIMLITDQPADDHSKKKLEESFELMDRAFGKEDFWAAELGHKGLASGAVTDVIIGGLERRMKMYHDVMEQRVEQYVQSVGV